MNHDGTLWRSGARRPWLSRYSAAAVTAYSLLAACGGEVERAPESAASGGSSVSGGSKNTGGVGGIIASGGAGTHSGTGGADVASGGTYSAGGTYSTGGGCGAGSVGGTESVGGSGNVGGTGNAGGMGGVAGVAGMGGVAGTGGVAATLPGCPPVKPSTGQPCVDGPYYCWYFDSVTQACADAAKCTNGSGPWAFLDAGNGYCNPVLSADFCDDGKPCGPVEPKGGCVVSCTRECTCNPLSSVLECSPVSC